MREKAQSCARPICELKMIAQERGGKCLSNKYVNALTQLLWECAEGHQWQAPPNRIKNGHWCKECGIKKGAALRIGDIIEMRNIAKERGGICLSEKYVNSSTKLIWECSIGHIWQAAPRDIKSGHWCKKCGYKKNAESRRLGIEKMHSIVKDRGGKCLSKIYANNKTKLLWECAIGHKWEATPNNVMRGSWCPACYKAKRST